MGSSDEAKALAALKRIEIGDLGPRKRYNLIERWCERGPAIADDESLRKLVEEKRRVIDRVLSYNLVPKTPLVVLILLKAVEQGQAGDLARTGYVRYYKFLIDSAILKHVTAEEAEGAYALLPEIAWTMHSTRASELSAQEIENTIELFSEATSSERNFPSTMFIAAWATRHVDNIRTDMKFKYKYTVLLFSSGLHPSGSAGPVNAGGGKGSLRRCSERESADILVFLAFHSNRGIIVDSLITTMSQAYPAASPFEFSKDRTASINKLIYEAPKLIVDHTSPKKIVTGALRQRNLRNDGRRIAMINVEDIGPLAGHGERFYLCRDPWSYLEESLRQVGRGAQEADFPCNDERYPSLHR